MGEQDRAVVKSEGGEVSLFEGALPPIADENIVAIAAKAEERLDALEKIKKLALKLTNTNDWVDENGKPYLQGSGAEKVARVFGVSWRINEPTMERLEGGHYIYTYTGEFALSRAIITAVGTRSSKDGFFKKYKWEGPEGNKHKVELPASEIDPGDVKKSAYTNLIANGVTRLLGLRNMTWPDLEKFAGITQAQVQSVEYKSSGKPQPGKAPAQKPGTTEKKEQPAGNGNGDKPVSEDQVNAIFSLMKKIGIKDVMACMTKVALILELQEIPTHATKLTSKQASQVIGTLQKEVDAAKGGGE